MTETGTELTYLSGPIVWFSLYVCLFVYVCVCICVCVCRPLFLVWIFHESLYSELKWRISGCSVCFYSVSSYCSCANLDGDVGILQSLITWLTLLSVEVPSHFVKTSLQYICFIMTIYFLFFKSVRIHIFLGLAASFMM